MNLNVDFPLSNQIDQITVLPQLCCGFSLCYIKQLQNNNLRHVPILLNGIYLKSLMEIYSRLN